MQDPIDRGLPFVIAEHDTRPPLETSLNTTAQAGHKGTIFDPIDLDFPAFGLDRFESSVTQPLGHFQFELNSDLLPPGQSKQHENVQELNSRPVQDPSGPKHANGKDSALTIWSVKDLLDHTEPPKFYTWEAFHGKDSSRSSDLALLSEAGPTAFDVALRPLRLQHEVQVLPQDYTLRALCNLALGRASSLFQWNESEAQFVPTLERAHISGLSGAVSTSTITSLANIGSIIARLRIFTEHQHVRRRDSPATSALRNCVKVVLNGIDQSISEGLGCTRSLLQLQSLVNRPSTLLRALEDIVRRAKDCGDDRALMSSVSESVSHNVIAEPRLRQVFAKLLERIAVPWFERLATCIGFQDPVNATMRATFQSNDDVASFMGTMPAFVTPEDAALIEQTNEAIRVLHADASSRALLIDTTLFDSSRAFDCFVNTTISSSEVNDIALSWESRKTHSTPQGRFRVDPDDSQDIKATHDFWTEIGQQSSYLSELDEKMSGSIAPFNSDEPELYDQVRIACRATEDSNGCDHANLAVTIAPSPLERVRPLIFAQNRLLNFTLLSQMFKEHRLSEHLHLQEQFHLFANGEFVTRLSTALFSIDVQSAERRRGTKPTAETMGLRLGTTHEERWPPASSELQLTLMGILADSYRSGDSNGFHEGVDNGQLPGQLSFAIRQLPEENIERVLDPNSIYALDFLRLQYHTKSPLDAVFTADSLENYDQIFCFLLRLLRLNHITATQPRRVLAQHKDVKSSVVIDIATQARHFVTVLTTHMLDIGTAAPWLAFIHEVAQIEKALDDIGGADQAHTYTRMNIQSLRQLHDACLERMRSRLFLRRKQEAVRLAIEDVLTNILKSVFLLSEKDTTSAGMGDAQLNVSRSIKAFHSALDHVARKPVKNVEAPDAEDADLARLLLSKLDWNCFYNASE